MARVELGRLVATSGEDETLSLVQTSCTRPVTLLGADVLCDWSGIEELRSYSDGHALWECPYCDHIHETHISEWEPSC